MPVILSQSTQAEGHLVLLVVLVLLVLLLVMLPPSIVLKEAISMFWMAPCCRKVLRRLSWASEQAPCDSH